MNTPESTPPQTVRLSVREIVGRDYAVESEAGQRVSDRIAEALRTGHRVELSFQNVELTIAAFLNVAVGQLLSEFSADELRDRLAVVDITTNDRALLKRVVDNAKEYFLRRAAGISIDPATALAVAGVAQPSPTEETSQ
jgi:STAS-like domain of unknown function (DUF4325)